MLATTAAFLATARKVFGAEPLPRKLAILSAAEDVAGGAELAATAAGLRTPRKRLADIAAAKDRVAASLGTDLHGPGADEQEMRRARTTLGTLLVGTLAERAFIRLYREMMGSHELRLEDVSGHGTDTDYRVCNGNARPVFRVNIKFFGSAFRNAPELVKLSPEDCFALATYKINQAIQKQEAEHLPYVFIVVGIHGLTGETAGKVMPDDYVHFLSIARASTLEKKRGVEDRIVRLMVDSEPSRDVRAAIGVFATQIEQAPWRVISARRANNLLREKLFDRVFAVRLRRFAQVYRGAEVDMHFSLENDLTPLPRFFEMMKTQGVHGISVALERGTV